ncbi:MAG: hypothetical protein KGS73_06925 [Chloroflexi bacterium]|nr:hypothetical protein [Chloroflexota bacterium]
MTERRNLTRIACEGRLGWSAKLATIEWQEGENRRAGHGDLELYDFEQTMQKKVEQFLTV